MTTLVTVKANGDCYPAKIEKFDRDGELLEMFIVPGGYSKEIWVGSNEYIKVTEEYHAGGYKSPL